MTEMHEIPSHGGQGYASTGPALDGGALRIRVTRCQRARVAELLWQANEIRREMNIRPYLSEVDLWRWAMDEALDRFGIGEVAGESEARQGDQA